MHPLLIWLTHFPKTKGDSWAFGRRLVSLITLIGIVCLVIWQYGHSTDSAQPEPPVGVEVLAASRDYLSLLAVAATAFIMVTILHVFFKFPFLSHCVESPRSWTSGKTVSEKDTDSPPVDTQATVCDEEELFSSGGDTVDIGSFPCTQFLDLAPATDDPADPNSTTDDDTLMPEYLPDAIVKSWASLETSRRPDDSQVMFSTSGHLATSSADIDLPGGAGEPGHTPLVCLKDAATQTDHRPKPATASVGTMTPSPQRADASVGCQNTYKLVKSSNTTTSGPFMKKLRRAQRLLKEARIKLRHERHSKLVTWTEILGRYKNRLEGLTRSLEKKDVLLSYTALNKALSEHEVKDMCTAVSSARDRLLTQCKLNSALKEVVLSKCDSVTSAASSQTTLPASSQTTSASQN